MSPQDSSPTPPDAPETEIPETAKAAGAAATGAAAGAGFSAWAGGAGLSILGGGVAIGIGTFAIAGAVIGLAGYGIYKAVASDSKSDE